MNEQAAQTISVCMMVKNEEEMLPRALESVKDLMDELIVVDTGSTDKTVEIAESYGAKIYHHPWQNNFALHRNQTIDYATKEWIFILDADEELDKEGVALLLKAAKESKIGVIAIPVTSQQVEGIEESAHNSIRMWRRALNIRYTGAVHNEVNHSGLTDFIPAKLRHYGYHLSREKMVQKFHRTVGILKQEMDKDPDNPKYPYYLGVSYLSEKMHADALEAARHSESLCRGERECQERWLANYYIMGACLIALRKPDEAFEACMKALDIFPDYLDAYAILSSVAFIKKDRLKLKEYSERYLELFEEVKKNPMRFSATPMHTLQAKPTVLMRLALDAWRNEEKSRYESFFDNALAEAERPQDIVITVGRHFIETNEIEETHRILDKSLERYPDNVELVNFNLKLLLDEGDFKEAERVVQAARANGIDKVKADFFEALVYLLSGKLEKAQAIYERMLEEDSENVEVIVNLGVIHEKRKDWGKAEILYHQAIDLDPVYYGRDAAVNLANVYHKMGRVEAAIKMLEKLIEVDDGLYEVHMKLVNLYWETGDADKLLYRGRKLGMKLDLPNAATVDTAAGLGNIFLLAAERLYQMHLVRPYFWALEMAMNLRPDDPVVHFHYGDAWLKKGDVQKAIPAFEQVVRLAPDHWAGYQGLAACAQILGDKESETYHLAKVEEIRKKEKP